jgi:4-hydroxybenzoate polyprenyltransferase
MIRDTQLPLNPLVVTLDDILVTTNLNWEKALQLRSSSPLDCLLMIGRLTAGRSLPNLSKTGIGPVDVAALPYRSETMAFLATEHAGGRRLWLMAPVNETIASDVARHVGIFEGTILLEGGSIKSAVTSQVKSCLGGADFDLLIRPEIAGAKRDGGVRVMKAKDLPENAHIEQLNDGGQGIAAMITAVDWRTWLRAWRIHQWAKNLLVFVPLIASHQIFDVAKLTTVFLAFVALSLCASATYIWNDLLDLPSDRLHPTKKNRPFASGKIPIPAGVVVSAALLLIGLLISIVFLNWNTTLSILLYIAVTVTYSTYLKRKLLVDVITLAGLFALRILVGAAAGMIFISSWLLVFSVFFFLSLAFVKRYSDLALLPPTKTEKMSGRGYYPQDLDLIRVMGPLAGYMAVLVMALYVNSPAVIELYSRPEWLWLVCLCLLYWISRVWFLAHRGQMPEDPVTFALKDKISHLAGVVMLGAVIMASIL